MALPKRRQSTRRKGKRRSAIKLNPPALVMCSNCRQLKKPHHVCPNCGFYKNRRIIKPKDENLA